MVYFAIFYGIFTIVGGLIGYFKAGSTISLVMGLVSGLAIIGCTLAWMKDRLWGYYTLIVISLLLGGWFLKGFLAEGKIMPHAVMVVLSLVNLVGLLLKGRKTHPTPDA
jgi:uncharacterized membrane protein (UPF0136 family)